MTELQIKKIQPLDNLNKNRLREFMKSIPENDLMELGIPIKEERGMNIFNSDILRGDLIPYIAIKNNEIWGMSFLWSSSAIYIPSFKPSDKKGDLNLAKLDGWEMLGCYTDPSRVGNGVFKTLSESIIEDTRNNQQLLYLIVRANQILEKELQNIYKKHLNFFNEIIEKKEYDFAAYVDYLMEHKIPAEEILKQLQSHELFDARASRLEYLWSRMVNEGRAFCVGNYFMDGAPVFVSNNY
jgi:hypothetical protein